MELFIYKAIVRFFVIFGLQILIFNNISFLGFSIPYMYVLYILILPFEINKTLLLFVGFLAGLVIDISTNSPGVHASATLTIAFFRPYIIRQLTPRKGYEVNTLPTLHYYGLGWFFKYSFVMVLIHHAVLYFNLSFSFHDLLILLLRVSISMCITLLLIIVSQYFIYKK